MNKRNLQKELDEIIAKNEGEKKKLLLHVCCAPCSSYCLEYLTKYFDVTVYFSNSNIDDSAEYEKRREEEKRLISQMCPRVGAKVKFVEGTYEPTAFHQLVKGHECDPEGGERCGMCFAMRLNAAAEYAAKNGFDYFTTSLSISPLKDAQRLCDIGEAAAKKYGVKYLPGDFKKKGGYQRSIELSKEYELYRQNYCGCSYSKEKSNG